MSNSLIKKNITFVITTFKSRNTIFECLDSLEPECKKIIIENSNDINLMKEIQDRYQNLSYQDQIIADEISIKNEMANKRANPIKKLEYEPLDPNYTSPL